MCINYFVVLACSQLNQKLRESTKEAQTDTSQAITEPQLVQPSVSIALQCVSISCHMVICRGLCTPSKAPKMLCIKLILLVLLHLQAHLYSTGEASIG